VDDSALRNWRCEYQKKKIVAKGETLKKERKELKYLSTFGKILT